MKARAEASERLSDEIVASLTSGLLVVDLAGSSARSIRRAGSCSACRRPIGPGPYAEVLGGAPELAAVIDECLARSPAGGAPHGPHDGRAGATHLGVTVSPIRDEAGRAYGAICLFTDLSEIMDLEDQLRLKDSLARLGELTAGIAHEFRNGLATIHGYARLLDLERLPEDYRPYVTGHPRRDRGARPGRHQLPELRQADAAGHGHGRHGDGGRARAPTTSARRCEARGGELRHSRRVRARRRRRRAAASGDQQSLPQRARGLRGRRHHAAHRGRWLDRSRSEDAARRGQRQRPGNQSDGRRTDVPALLHDQGAGHRASALRWCRRSSSRTTAASGRWRRARAARTSR